jgi:hypothetical protein
MLVLRVEDGGRSDFTPAQANGIPALAAQNKAGGSKKIASAGGM